MSVIVQCKPCICFPGPNVVPQCESKLVSPIPFLFIFHFSTGLLRISNVGDSLSGCALRWHECLSVELFSDSEYFAPHHPSLSKPLQVFLSTHSDSGPVPGRQILRWFTYTWELDATVTALGCGTLLLEVEVTELATWSPDNADLVGGRVVPVIEVSANAHMPHSSRPSLSYRMATARR